MKTKTKQIWKFFLFVALLFVATACSKDDEQSTDKPGGATTKAPFEVSIFQGETIELPEVIQKNNNPKAIDLASDFEELTSFYDDQDLFNIPVGAVKSTSTTSVGSRPAAAAKSAAVIEYTVYTYSYTAGGEMTYLIYQYSVQNGMDVVEIFMKSDAIGTMKLASLQQRKDGKQGTMSMYIMGFALQWTWTINDDGSVDISYILSNGNRWDLHFKEDQSGTLRYYSNSELVYEYIWTAAGSGTFTNYREGVSVDF